LLPPTNLITRPNNSPCRGNIASFRKDSDNTFLLPIFYIHLTIYTKRT
jgi:hypothetical protein